MSASDPLLRRRDVEAEVGLKKTAIYDMIARDEFPKGLKVTSRDRRWRLSEIQAWKRSRPVD